MKTKAINQSFVILLFVILGASCTEKTCIEEPPIIQIDTIYINDTTYIYDTVYIMAPAVAILGKWEEFEYGNWSDIITIEEPDLSLEFLSDSIYKVHDYETGIIHVYKYWIEGNFLYYGSVNAIGTSQYSNILEYKFSNNNTKLRLKVYPNPSLIEFVIYKRIE